jgi:phosphonate transport system permease protein
MSVLAAAKVSEARAQAKPKILFIDFCFSFYTIFCFYYLITYGLTLIAEPSWPLLLSVSGVGALVWAIVLQSKKNWSIGRQLLYKTNPTLKSLKNEVPEVTLTSYLGIYIIALNVLTFALGWILTEISFYNLFSEDGITGARNIFTSLFQPNMAILSMVVKAMIETIFIAFMATSIALPIAFIGSFFAARNLTKGTKIGFGIYTTLRLIANFTRSVEPIIWAIIFSVWVGIGPFAGMLALMLHSIASLIKLYSEQIESIDDGPVEAMLATGANRVQMVWYAVVPQIIMPFMGFTIYRWDINIRMATIIGLVGGGGVGTLLMQYQGLAKWNEVGTIVIVIALVVWVMDYLSAKIREAIH